MKYDETDKAKSITNGYDKIDLSRELLLTIIGLFAGEHFNQYL